MIGFDEALRRLCAAARPIGAEEVPIGRAAGRVLAKPVSAAIRAPASDVSTMDGYAVREADLARLPARLAVTGESLPGHPPPLSLESGQCMRIFTGAALPRGADRVVIQEVVRRDGATAEMTGPLDKARFVRRAGSDFEAGDVLVAAGTLLGPRSLVAAAAADVARLSVWRRPLVWIVGTGDELAEPGSARDRPGAIPDSISHALAAMAEQWGARVSGRTLIADDLPRLEAAAGEAVAAADLVVVTGGASVGERDHAKRMFGAAGLDLLFSKVAIKPGKPVWLGRAGAALVLGLPGNPTSALVTARLFLAPLLCGMTGRDPAAALAWRQAVLGEAVAANGDRETFARGTVVDGEVRLLANQDSGSQSSLALADLLVRRPIGAEAMGRGAEIQILDFQ
jgi:molybdopterin molybdotransferase